MQVEMRFFNSVNFRKYDFYLEYT